ncbi:polysaccharide pyruvyl transferase family protein [Endozoicomonas sp. ISHI1]|uniref:polysaccharide pyruvyl transferase family protein n=1 Tax=Endozoicomonas sp. ISHI1 TaxID=2825882 RepID=UPI00214904E1|nr:polysaccharide pyruvyl transferase family protein [Endozoicomonas sp. ISHI1]
MKTFFLQTVPNIVNPELSLREKLDVTVRNTGNYFFETAVKKQLSGMEVISSFNELPKGADKLVLSMSNFMSPHTDLGPIADNIERLNVKQIVMIGAGAQANSYTEEVKLTKGTERFLKVIANRSETIGVRGNFTNNLLEEYGVTNGEVIGCPSIFMNLDRNFKVNKSALPNSPKLVTHYTPTGHYRDNIAHINNFAIENCESYIAQSEVDLLSAVEKKVEDKDIEYMFGYYNNGKYSKREFRDWFHENTKWFFDIDEWFSYMAQVDFSIGTRFHGNMGAIQAGTPALNLVFDTRTRELCEYLNLPTMFLDEFNGEHTVDELYEKADYGLFNASYSHKYDKYVDFLNKNGVSHNLGEADSEVSSYSLNPVAQKNIVDLLSSIEGKEVNDKLISDYLRSRVRGDRAYEIRKLAEKGEYGLKTI